MPQRQTITVAELEEIYNLLDFYPKPDEPGTFIRASRDITFRHDPYPPTGEYDVITLIEEINRQEVIYGSSEDIAGRFYAFCP